MNTGYVVTTNNKLPGSRGPVKHFDLYPANYDTPYMTASSIRVEFVLVAGTKIGEGENGDRKILTPDRDCTLEEAISAGIAIIYNGHHI